MNQDSKRPLVGSVQGQQGYKSITRRVLRIMRFQNIIDNAISKGFGSLIAILSAVSLSIVLIAGFVYMIFCRGIDMGPAEAFWTAFSFLTNPELPKYEDASQVVSYTIVTLIVVVIGLLVTSILIGIVTTAFTSYYEGLQRGFSPVMEKGHIAIIGFNDNAHTLMSELCKTHEKNGLSSLVFLDDKLSREEMERRIEGYVGAKIRKIQKKGLTILCRNGDLRETEDLKRCAVHRARAIIINDFDDSAILKTLLAVVSLLRRESIEGTDAPTIVCTFREHQFARAASHVGYKSNLRVLSLSSTLSNLVAKTCYQPGLSKVLDEVYSYQGSEFYFISDRKLDGLSFDELVNVFELGIPIGICRKDDTLTCGANIIVNIPNEYDEDNDDEIGGYEQAMTLRPGDELIVLAPDAASARLLRLPTTRARSTTESSKMHATPEGCEQDHLNKPKRPLRQSKTDHQEVERVIASVMQEPLPAREECKSILVIGYDETFDRSIANLVRHYRSIAAEGEINCKVKLLYRNKREKRVYAARRRLLDEYGELNLDAVEIETAHGYNSAVHPLKDILAGSTQISFQCALVDVIDLPVLERVFLQGETFDHVIVLSDLIMDREQADTETLLTLLYLRAIADNALEGRYGKDRIRPFSITSEIQNMENVDLAYNEYVSDYIISWKFIGSLQVQIAENRHLYKVLRDLLTPGGPEIQLEHVTTFVDPASILEGARVDFDALAIQMRSYPEISQRRVLIGYIKRSTGEYTLCPRRDAYGRRIVSLCADDMLVVIKTT